MHWPAPTHPAPMDLRLLSRVLRLPAHPHTDVPLATSENRSAAGHQRNYCVFIFSSIFAFSPTRCVFPPTPPKVSPTFSIPHSLECVLYSAHALFLATTSTFYSPSCPSPREGTKQVLPTRQRAPALPTHLGGGGWPKVLDGIQ